MEGAGTDLDPATKDTTIREKEESILNRLTDGYYGSGEILDGNWNGSGMRSHYYEAYRQIDRAITLDLGQLSHIESLSFHMQEGLVLKIDAAAFFLIERGAHEVRLDAQLGTHGCHFFLGGRAQMHPRAGHDLLQLAQLAIVGKINRNHTISLLSAPKRTAAEIRKRRCAKRCSIFAGMIALEDRPPRTVTPFLCQLLRFRRKKSPRASKDSSVHEVPAEQELYYY